MTLYVKACYVTPRKMVQKASECRNARQAKLVERAHGDFAHPPGCRAGVSSPGCGYNTAP
jgi:hypothetical protein